MVDSTQTLDDVVLIPVFDDWASLSLLLPQIDDALAQNRRSASVIIVNDCSIQPPSNLSIEKRFTAINSVDILSLTRNVGHQRALAIGISYIATQRPCRAVIILDGDGEDRPSDIPKLLTAFETNGGTRVVFAQRTRRSEGLVFTMFYRLYRLAHRLMTGIRVEVGNFSVIPYASVQKLAVVSEIWNHYAAAVVHAKFPSVLVPTERGNRLAGRSSMDFVALVGHGLSAMSVFSDKIAVRMLAVTGFVVSLLVIAFVAVMGVRIFTDIVVPGWTTTAFIFMALLLAQAGLLAVVFSFMTQADRARSSFIPAKEYEPFVESFYRVWPSE
ncbi:MAG TPA: glycosyltransferase [Gemmatimonadaceae bacterium]|nr:glycosyltransferase [Gemmatimonadaceae bacterium]